MRWDFSALERQISRYWGFVMPMRNLVRSQWWWVVVLVLWVLDFLGVFVITNIQMGQTLDLGLVPILMLTLVVIVAKAAEYLTRPAQTAQQAKQHTSRKV